MANLRYLPVAEREAIYKEIFKLDAEGLTSRQISARIGCKPGTVRQRLTYARRRIAAGGQPAGKWNGNTKPLCRAGLVFRGVLADRKISIDSFAAAVGVSHQTVGHWLSGGRMVSIEHALMIERWSNMVVKSADWTDQKKLARMLVGLDETPTPTLLSTVTPANTIRPGTLLRAELARRKITLASFGSTLGVNVSHWLSGATRPNLEHALVIEAWSGGAIPLGLWSRETVVARLLIGLASRLGPP